MRFQAWRWSLSSWKVASRGGSLHGGRGPTARQEARKQLRAQPRSVMSQGVARPADPSRGQQPWPPGQLARGPPLTGPTNVTDQGTQVPTRELLGDELCLNQSKTQRAPPQRDLPERPVWRGGSRRVASELCLALRLGLRHHRALVLGSPACPVPRICENK